MTVREKQQQEDPSVGRPDLGLEEVLRILRSLNQQREEELVKDVSGAVRNEVSELLDDWTRYLSLPVTREARDTLAAHVARLVQDAINANTPRLEPAVVG